MYEYVTDAICPRIHEERKLRDNETGIGFEIGENDILSVKRMRWRIEGIERIIPFIEFCGLEEIEGIELDLRPGDIWRRGADETEGRTRRSKRV